MMVRRGLANGERGVRLVWTGSRDRGGSLILGLYLIVLGVFIWLGQQGFIDRTFWRDGWPWILVVIGVGTLLSARSASRVSDGVGFALLGVWFLIVKSGWHGLTWRNSWPLILVAIGASLVAKAFAGMFLPEKEPKRMKKTSREEDDDHE